MIKRIGILLTAMVLLCACGSSINMKKAAKGYGDIMKQAELLSKILCEHSEFSACYWKSALGGDFEKLPSEAVQILNQIHEITAGKTYEDLTECEKGQLLGLWQRFTYLVGKDVIEKVVPFMLKYVF